MQCAVESSVDTSSVLYLFLWSTCVFLNSRKFFYSLMTVTCHDYKKANQTNNQNGSVHS